MAWKVTAQVPTTMRDNNGVSGPGMLVHFQLDDGTPGQVFLPSAQYNAANVKNAIAAQAAHMDEVNGLTG